MKLHLFHNAPAALKKLTHQRYYLLIANGTDGIASLTNLCLTMVQEIAVPALSCWAVTQGALIGGAKTLRYMDASNELAPLPLNKPNCIELHTVPWFNQLKTPNSTCVVDLSANISLDYCPEKMVATLISLGAGKPGYWPSRGAIITTDDRNYACEIETILSMNQENFQWSRWMPRLTLVESSDDAVNEHFQWLDSIRTFREESARQLDAWVRKSCTQLKPVLSSYSGNSTLIPFLYLGHKRMESLLPLLRLHNIPLGWQPVSPAYLEPALSSLSLATRGECPYAESVSKRLLFIPALAAADQKGLDKITRILEDE